ncbi:MAG: Thioredoxin [Candidatus Pacebacteria bacterium GW2011_GWF2_38_9]|nr:MAG: thioredoxin [candidate division TM6 bacterium GW2011_GWF2_28_16]KKQ07525.1 MAG: Thioredoxin [Candidatus Pacebacteria bacterium GW2011_GWF1_36_5]KKQ88751.1 MAG: Thioredoxin [Candidatus Pacebacteria bacterium GW2011_GWF2_38_9]HAZ73717.1 thioredoxin [Candidatus Paceibacterota bacterium]
MPAVHLDSNNFKASVEDAKGVVFVDFFAVWCGPCQMSAPIVDKMVEDYAGKAAIVKVDVDQAREPAMKYNVMSIPTFIVFKDGQEVDRQIGFPGEDALKAMVDKAIKS